MSTIKIDQRRLDNIANAYHKTGGEVREMWKNKWYELVRKIGRRLEDESKRPTTNIR
jgi:hypothetical protein